MDDMVTCEVHFWPSCCTDICCPLWFIFLAWSAVWKIVVLFFLKAFFDMCVPGLHNWCTDLYSSSRLLRRLSRIFGIVCWLDLKHATLLFVVICSKRWYCFTSLFIYILYICILSRARNLALLILLRLLLGQRVAQNTHRTNFRQWCGPKVMVRRQAASVRKGRKDGIFSWKLLCTTWRRRVCKIHNVKKRLQRTMCILAGMYTL